MVSVKQFHWKCTWGCLHCNNRLWCPCPDKLVQCVLCSGHSKAFFLMVLSNNDVTYVGLSVHLASNGTTSFMAWTWLYRGLVCSRISFARAEECLGLESQFNICFSCMFFAHHMFRNQASKFGAEQSLDPSLLHCKAGPPAPAIPVTRCEAPCVVFHTAICELSRWLMNHLIHESFLRLYGRCSMILLEINLQSPTFFMTLPWTAESQPTLVHLLLPCDFQASHSSA